MALTKLVNEEDIYSESLTMHLDNRMLFVGRPDEDDLLHIWNIDSKQHPAQAIYNPAQDTD